MNEEYYYYIFQKPYDNLLEEELKHPVIVKLAIDKYPFIISHQNQKDVEGPFDSLFELKRKSLIFAGVTLQKHRQRILKSGNIKEIKEAIFTKIDASFEKSFIYSFSHIIVGKISKGKVKGVHFYDPDKTRIIKEIKKDNSTGVYAARIQLLNEITGQWIEKDDISTFFPDNWSIQQLFHECDFAYMNRKHETGKVYSSKTLSGIKVKFIIDQDNDILTFYPEIE